VANQTLKAGQKPAGMWLLDVSDLAHPSEVASFRLVGAGIVDRILLADADPEVRTRAACTLVMASRLKASIH